MLAVFREMLVNLAASAVSDISSPTGMLGYLIGLGCLVYAVIAWHRKRMAAGQRGMDSWYFIGFSFFVAVVAIWATGYGMGLRIPASANPVAAITPPPSVAETKEAPAPRSSLSVLVSNRYYSTKNKEEVADRLDRISSVLNKIGGEILEQAEIAINGPSWENAAGAKAAPFVERMDRISDLTVQMHKALYDNLVDQEREYRVEINKILFPKEPFTNFQVAVNDFRNALSVWMEMRDTANNANQHGLSRLVHASRMSFANARQAFVNWLSRQQELIDATRVDLRKT